MVLSFDLLRMPKPAACRAFRTQIIISQDVHFVESHCALRVVSHLAVVISVSIMITIKMKPGRVFRHTPSTSRVSANACQIGSVRSAVAARVWTLTECKPPVIDIWGLVTAKADGCPSATSRAEGIRTDGDCRSDFNHLAAVVVLRQQEVR